MNQHSAAPTPKRRLTDPLRKCYWGIREIGIARRRRTALRDLARLDSDRPPSQPIQPPQWHAQAAAHWLARAQDATGCDGVSKCYNLARSRWEPAYPETSGYIIGSFLNAAAKLGDSDLEHRARRIADWLVHIQLPCGGIQSGTLSQSNDPSISNHRSASASIQRVAWASGPRDSGPCDPGPRDRTSRSTPTNPTLHREHRTNVHPTIFNTGQVVHGWIDAWDRWADRAHADAAIRACRWLISQQDDDGCWRRGGSPSVTRQAENVYNVRVAWAMIRAGRALNKRSFENAGRRNLDWAAKQETAPGFLDRNDFDDCARPLMHTIAYAAESFLESGHLLGHEGYLAVANRIATAVRSAKRPDGHLPGRLDARARAAARWVCLTGDAQMLLVFRRLSQAAGITSHDDAAARLSVALRRRQIPADHPIPEIRGALAGSYPLDGDYMKMAYPNWAAKFFLDAMLVETAREAVRCDPSSLR